ncbi:hypothetical protein [Frankia tisae]|uniref:hypothetical protein n=1 Tax=Frankia tisae TaxID=2950104 RepID=UPI0021C0978F|nr:hypothetical protein [Frankia tisae]
MRIASRPSAPRQTDPGFDPTVHADPNVHADPTAGAARRGADAALPAVALAPVNLAGTAVIGRPPSWPLVLAWAAIATLMMITQAVAIARRGRGGGGRPRARRAVATPRARPVPPSARSGDPAHRFDPTGFEPLADRMTLLLQDFLAASVPRPGRPARIDLRAPATSWFVDAFTAASDLLIGTCQTDRPDTLAAAVREAERRWGLVDTWTRETGGPAGHDNPDVTDRGPQPT